MGPYTKEQLLHLDLPEEFRSQLINDPLSQVSLSPSWDLILLGITLFLLLENNV